MTTQDLTNNRSEIIAYLNANSLDTKKAMNIMVKFIDQAKDWQSLADLAIKKQKTVIHSKFGTGVIIENNVDVIIVDFNGTVKELMKTYANLKTLEGSAFEGIETNEDRKSRIASE